MVQALFELYDKHFLKQNLSRNAVYLAMQSIWQCNPSGNAIYLAMQSIWKCNLSRNAVVSLRLLVTLE